MGFDVDVTSVLGDSLFKDDSLKADYRGILPACFDRSGIVSDDFRK
jgi:hypothetical protein